ncbi:MAG TPA: amidase [Burkholderiaceae bacterium]|nr:amidase [Burkholderiaceae bacterium]
MFASEPDYSELATRDRDIRAWAYLGPDAPVPTPRGCVTPALAGLPFGVKDVIDVRGMPTGHGAALRDPVPARFDAACVAMLRQAGAYPVGKTVTAEFAVMAPGPTRNPWNLEHTPGGSSSGSAAAVAAGMVPMCLGTQTGGSIIRPAAFNGIVGFKPSAGLVPRTGMLVLSDTLDTIGWFTRDVALSRQVAAVFAQHTHPHGKSTDARAVKDTARTVPPAGDTALAAGPNPLPTGLRVAVLPAQQVGDLDKEALAVLEQAAQDLAGCGAQVVRPDAGELFSTALPIHGGIMQFEVARGLLPVLQSEETALRSITRDFIHQGLTISAAEHVELLRQREQLRAEWLERLGDFDLVLTPSAPGAAPRGHASTGSSVFNRTWSLLGWPCVHLPLTQAANGLPLGVQLVGKPGGDLALLTLAQTLHASLDRRNHQEPPLVG